ncbi:protein phosphatase 2C domain-containing protein [bacterium]|nr:protein phosphatase 2C domain-containing protein [bacterium]
MHTRCDIPNQDSWMSRHYNWGHVVVVSDGLGSKKHSDYGSKAACLSVIEAAKSLSNTPLGKIDDLFRLIHANWLLRISPYSPSECAATCLFAIQLADQLFVGRLGDGIIALHFDDNEGNIVLHDNKNETFSNYTSCLTDVFDKNDWQPLVVSSRNCRSIILCTDGISDDLLADQVLNFTKELCFHYRYFERTKRSREIKRWLNNWPVPGHTDDKTLACLQNIKIDR